VPRYSIFHRYRGPPGACPSINSQILHQRSRRGVGSTCAENEATEARRCIGVCADHAALAPAMNHKERLAKAFRLQMPDHPPILGGWLRAPDTIWRIAGCSEDEYYADPVYWGIEAERALGSDGVIRTFEPKRRGAYRKVDHAVLAARNWYTVDRALAEINGLPEPAQQEAEFDFEAEYARFRTSYARIQSMCEPMQWCPAGWEVIPKALWFERYGFETSFTLLSQYPQEYRKLIRGSAIRGRQQASLHARAMREGLAPIGVLTGEDLCSSQGPMVSPEFLRREYFPLVEYAIEPLLEAGGKLVWHCDGNYQALVDDVLACGMAGLQGFQKECGMDLEWIVDRRTVAGDPLLIFGPVSVTRTLPFGTPEDVEAEVRWAMETCRGRASLVFLASNTITPDIPIENIRAFWDAVLRSSW
jgi:hypothetical protein